MVVFPAINITDDCRNQSVIIRQEVTESENAWSILIHVTLLTACLMAAFVLHKVRSLYFSHSGAAVVIGLIGGIFVKYGLTSEAIETLVSFDRNVFFLFVLPPIMLEAGMSVNRQAFMVNLGSILPLAFLGVLINTLVFGGLLYAVCVLGWAEPHLTLLECLLFGSIISATDPVTVLAVFGSLKVDADLYANVFGESALNDAVAIVMFRSLTTLEEQALSAGVVFIAVGKFAYIFAGSFAIGVTFAVVLALILKYTNFAENPQIELGIIITFAYASYLVCDALELSGIVSTLFFGFFFAHYAEPNLQGSTIFSRGLFIMLAFIAETQAFVSLGLGIWNDTSLRWSGSLIGWSIGFCLVARAIMIPVICYPISWIRSSLPIPWQHQVMLWHAGLRGALAFSLTFAVTTKHSVYIATSTVAIIISSIIVLGGTSIVLLDKLQIKRGQDVRHEHHSMPSWLHRATEVDRKYVRPFLCGKLFEASHIQIGSH